MDEFNRSLQNYSLSHDNLKKVVNDPNSLLVLAKESERILKHMVQYHANSIKAESGPHDSSSCVICEVGKALFDKLNNDRVSPSIPESKTVQENGEPEGSAPGSFGASNSFGEDGDQFKAGSEHESHDSVPSSLYNEIKEVPTSDPGTSDGVDDEQLRKGKPPGPTVLSLDETSDKKDEQCEGHEREKRQPGQHTEKTAGTEEPNDFAKYNEEISELNKKHEDFFHKDTTQNTLLEKLLRHANNNRLFNCILTYFDYDTESNKMRWKYKLFDDEQQSLSWACSKIPPTGASLRFIRLWGLDDLSNLSRLQTDDLEKNQTVQLGNPSPSQANAGMKKKGKDLSDSSSPSKLHTDDLMINEIELVNPSSNTVIAKVNGMWDTGADFASFPFDPRITKTLINGITKINGKWCPVVYAKLIINGKMLPKIYKVEMEPDETWCAIGNPQMADLDRHGKEEIFRKMEQVVFSKKE